MTAYPPSGSSALSSTGHPYPFNVINVRDYGAMGDGSTDDTAAFEAAQAASTAGTTTILGRGIRPYIYVPNGLYMVHEVDITYPGLIGEEQGTTYLRYNGAGGPGSYVLAVNNVVPSGGGFRLEGLTINGNDFSLNNTPIAENCLKFTGVTTFEYGMMLKQLILNSCFGDAIYSEKVVINGYINNIRFDAVGGYCLAIVAGASGENRPLVMRDMTMGNGGGVNFETNCANQGYRVNGKFGKGVAYFHNCTGLFAKFDVARLEITERMIPNAYGVRALYHTDTDNASSVHISLVDVRGYTPSNDSTVLLHAGAGHTNYRIENSGVLNCKYFEDTVTPENDIGKRNSTSILVHNAETQQQFGIAMNGQNLEMRDAIPGSSAFQYYREGDTAFNRQTALGSNVGWQVVSPTTGFGMGTLGNLTTTAVVTAASAVISIVTWGSDMQVGLAVTCVGAGAAGVDLLTRITAIDSEAMTITVADVPSTSVSPATIKYVAPVWATFGFLGEKRGATSVADGGTITHGVTTTPTNVMLTPTVAGEMAAVTTIGSTTFTVAIKKHDNTAGTTQTIHWRAIP